MQSSGPLYCLYPPPSCYICNLHFANSIEHDKNAVLDPAKPPHTNLH